MYLGCLGGAIVVKILYWDGSLVVLVLPYRRPTPHFTTDWVDSTFTKVRTLSLFY